MTFGFDFQMFKLLFRGKLIIPKNNPLLPLFAVRKTRHGRIGQHSSTTENVVGRYHATL